MRASEYKITFGKHKGESLDDVPASYLLWLKDQEWISKFPEIISYIEDNYNAILEDAAYAKNCDATESDIY